MRDKQICGQRHAWCRQCRPEIGEKILESNRRRQEMPSLRDRPRRQNPRFTEGQLVIIGRVLAGHSVEDIAAEFGVSTRRVYHMLAKVEAVSLLDLKKQVPKILAKVCASDPIWPFKRGAQTRAVMWIIRNFANEKEVAELSALGVI